MTVKWKHLVNLSEAEELWDLTYFPSPPHMPLQVVCNYCFSSPAKELAHGFGTLTDAEQPREALPDGSKATRTWEEGKIPLYQGDGLHLWGFTGKGNAMGTGRGKKEDEKLVGEEKNRILAVF